MSVHVRSAVAAFIAVVVSLTMVGIAAPASAVTSTTVLEMVGDSGSIVGTAVQSYAPPATAFTASGTTDNVTVSTIEGAYVHWWDVRFRAPEGQVLTAGTTYTDAQRAAFAVAPHPGLDLYGDGRGCSAVTGSFTVLEIEADGTGAITRFAATFEHHCEGQAPATRGAVYVNSTLTYASLSTLALSGPATVAPLAPVALTGALSSAAGPIAAATVTVSRTDASGTTPLPDATTTVDGSFAVADTIGTSNATYTASYAGDADHQAAQATWAVAIVKPASTLTVVAPTAAKRGVAFAVSGALSNGGSPVAGAHLVIVRKDLSGTRTLSAVTAASGAWSLKDVPAVGGTVTFTVSWAGDATRAAVSASRNVAVSRTATAMSIKVSKSLYSYRARAVITVHLGTTYNGRTVTVFARPYGASAATRLVTARVNSAGNVVVASLISRRTTYSAVFAGDYRYAPVSHSVTPNVVSSVVITPASYSSRSGSTYRYHGKDPLFRVVVQPGRAYGCISMQVQYSRSSRWVAGVSLACGTLDSTSTDYIIFRSNRPKGVKFRVRGYVGASSYSAAGSSPWTYFVFV